jgi:urease accessory protein
MTVTMTTMAMSTEAALYRLMTWLSPAYPVGGYSYSHGLEYAVEAQLVRNAATLEDWVGAILLWGSGRVDAALFIAAYRAVRTGDTEDLDKTIALAMAWRSTSETALESEGQGTAFLATTLAAWPHPELAPIAARHRKLPLAIAAALACACHRVPIEFALPGYLHAFAANLVSAGVRLIPLGQSDGQRIIAKLEASVARAVETANDRPLEEIGTAAPMLDWCSMRHETQYTKLFRS